ncbi:MAG: winged helix-turn-helix domain-containing protein [Alphaproteobacteria bacterium]
MIYSFDDCHLDVDRRQFLRDGQLVSIEPQVFRILLCLIRNRHRLVTRDDLILEVWNGREYISESTISSRITAARRAIGDSGKAQRLIRTKARQGFLFVGEVVEHAPPSGDRDRSGPPTDQAGGGDASSPSAAPETWPGKPSIAILPLVNMSGDPEQEYFTEGISEEIITALSRLRWFFVIARYSSFVYKGENLDMRQIGRELGVRYILHGSIRKSGQAIRVTARLMDATTGICIWSERYDREVADMFALQDEITASVAATIEPRLLAAEALRIQARKIDDLGAWDLVARALSHFWRLTDVGGRTAIDMLTRAVKQHPDYAPAHSTLAIVLAFAAYTDWQPLQHVGRLAMMHAHQATELDERDPWAHLALGFLAFMYREPVQAVRSLNDALELNPNFALAQTALGGALAMDGRSEAALLHLDQAMKMNPRDLVGLNAGACAVAHYLAGRYDEAIRWARDAVRQRSGTSSYYRILCASLAQAGQMDEARAVLNKLRELQPKISLAWIEESVPYTAEPMRKFLKGMQKAGLT